MDSAVKKGKIMDSSKPGSEVERLTFWKTRAGLAAFPSENTELRAVLG